MSKFETAFKAAIARKYERRILISTLLASPDLTLGELHKLSKGKPRRLFSEITISDLISGGAGGASPAPAAGRRGPGKAARGASAAVVAPGRRGAASKAAAPAAPAAEAAAPAEAKGRGGASKARGKAKAVNTRTAEGRAEYDEALFQAVKEHGGPVGAGALIAKVGGTSLQARAGLARLIEAGRITWSGKARGTKYSVL
jgi:hypothetical protein